MRIENIALKSVAPPRNNKNKVRRTIYVGLGGTGNEIVRQIKREALEHGIDTPLLQYCVLDTVAYNERPGMSPLMHLRNGEEYLNIGNYNPNEVLKNRENWPVITKWWGNRSTSNLVTVDEGAGQMRAVGRMGFFFNFDKIEGLLRRKVDAIMGMDHRAQAMGQGFEVSNAAPIVYLFFSLCGGTGSSLFFDVTYTIRELLKASEHVPEVVAVALLPGPYLKNIISQPQRERIQANAYAALMELERLHNMALGLDSRPNGRDLWQVQYSSTFEVASAELPFSYVYLIDDTTSTGEIVPLKGLYQRVARAVFWLSGSAVGTIFWERAKNLMSKTVASGARTDAAGTRRLGLYSSLGVSTIAFDWRQERMQHELENRLIRQLQAMPPYKIELPPYLNMAIALFEELCGENSGISSFTWTNRLRPNRTFTDRAAIEEMIEQFDEKYSAALNRITLSPAWRARKERYRSGLKKVLDEKIVEALKQSGPLAAATSLETLSTQLETVLRQATEQLQAQQMQRATLQNEYMQIAHTNDSETTFGKIFALLRSLPGRLYFFEPFRRNSNSRQRTLRIMAEEAADKRYAWYNTSYQVAMYDEIIKSILNPMIAQVNEQLKSLRDVNSDFEAWLERNQLEDQVTPTMRERNWFEHVRPKLAEEEQIELAINTGRVKVEECVRQILQRAFRPWPNGNKDVLEVLEPALKEYARDLLRYIGGEEHLAQRLLNYDCSDEREMFLTNAECLWNFTREANQEVLPYLETINMVGYGIDTRQVITTHEVEDALNLLMRDQEARPEPISTHVVDELAFIKTQHGLMISALRMMNEMQSAYQLMKTVRRAPYLHIDYSDAVRTSYRPLTSLAVSAGAVLLEWKVIADGLNENNALLSDEISVQLERYKVASKVSLAEQIDVNDVNHPLFDLIDGLSSYLGQVNPTTAILQAMVKLASLDELLLAQGWIKIEPGYGERYDDQLHDIRGYAQYSDLRPRRIVELLCAGYIRQRGLHQPPLVRKALVKLSS